MSRGLHCATLKIIWVHLLSVCAGETTFAVIVETDDDLEPLGNNPTDGVSTAVPCATCRVLYLVVHSKL